MEWKVLGRVCVDEVRLSEPDNGAEKEPHCAAGDAFLLAQTERYHVCFSNGLTVKIKSS